MANRRRTADTPNLAAQGQSVSRKTAAEVPLTGLSFSFIGISQRLRLDAHDRLLGLLHEGIQLGTRPNVQPPEPLEELPQVLDGRIPEDLGLAVVKPS